MDAYWRATQFSLRGTEIYLHANPLLRKLLKREHVKPCQLETWGTS